WARDLRDAYDRHNRVNGLYVRLSASSQPRQKDLSETFGRLSRLTELGYNYVRDRKFEAPRNYEPGDPVGADQSLLGGRYLPSTMLRDFAAIHTGARLLDEWKGYDRKLKGNVKDTMSLDEQATLAALGVGPGAKEAELLPRETDWRDDDVIAGLIGEDA